MLSIINQLVNLIVVKITVWLEIQGALQNWKGPQIFFTEGPGIFTVPIT